MKFRQIRADEIECRVATINENGCSLLLYKDARTDQNILDETLGVFGWQRSHQLIGDRLYCTVSVKNPETGEWISKQDVGTESYTEKEKGQASDSFKRACFNLGIGRELYTAPFIWIGKEKVTIKQGKNGKPATYDKFVVRAITYTDGKISSLQIYNQDRKKVVYSYGTDSTDYVAEINTELERTGLTIETILDRFGKKSLAELTQTELKRALDGLAKTKDKDTADTKN